MYTDLKSQIKVTYSLSHFVKFFINDKSLSKFQKSIFTAFNFAKFHLRVLRCVGFFIKY